MFSWFQTWYFNLEKIKFNWRMSKIKFSLIGDRIDILRFINAQYILFDGMGNNSQGHTFTVVSISYFCPNIKSSTKWVNEDFMCILTKVIFWLKMVKTCTWQKFNELELYFYWFRRQKCLMIFGHNLVIPDRTFWSLVCFGNNWVEPD